MNFIKCKRYNFVLEIAQCNGEFMEINAIIIIYITKYLCRQIKYFYMKHYRNDNASSSWL